MATGLINIDIPPDQAGYSATLAVNGISTPVEHGAARYRRAYVGGSSTVNVQWSLGVDEHSLLVSLFEGVLSSGTVPFTIDLIIDAAPLQTYTAYLRPGTFRIRRQSGLTYITSATLEVLRDPQAEALNGTNTLVGILSDKCYQTYATTISETVNDVLGSQSADFGVVLENNPIAAWNFLEGASMFQDAAGTTAAALYDPVGLVRDRTDNGNDIQQTVDGSRPIRTTRGLIFDGQSAFMQTVGNLILESTTQVTVVVSMLKYSDAAIATALGHSSNPDANNGTFEIRAPNAAGGAFYQARARGTSVRARVVTGRPAPDEIVFTLQADTGADSISARADGVDIAPTTGLGSANFGSYPFFLGSRGGNDQFLNGSVTALAIYPTILATTPLGAVEDAMAALQHRTL